jgi:hypothetical protein
MKLKIYPENRKIKYLLTGICIILLAVSCYYNYSRPVGLKILMNDPEKNNNQEITASGEVRNINKPFYTLYDATSSASFIVKNSTDDWKINDFIAFRGNYKKEGYIEYISGEIIWDKKIKLAISIIAFAAFIILIVFEYKKIKFEL